MRNIAATILLLLSITAISEGAVPYVVVLGVGQDAGVPQMGCETPFCRRARNDASLKQTVSSIALIDPETKSRWIFDTTPDLPEQFDLLKTITGDRSNSIAGIFLTHAHIGHYTGLMYLGRESMSTKEIPVFAMPRMKQMLEANAPWSQLVGLKNIKLTQLSDSVPSRLTDKITVEPFLVPHRDEFSETVGYRIHSGEKTLIFIPDIDKWQKWANPLSEIVRSSDYLLIDGTFYADGEINRPVNEVPHPFVSETMDLLKELPMRERSKVYFIHFNHSNPLVQGSRTQIDEVKSRGFHIARRGLKLYL